METKVCNTCNTEQPVTNFHKFRNGVRNYCSKCSTEMGKKYREQNPERYESFKNTQKIKRKTETDEERKIRNLKKRAWKRGVSIEVILEEERIYNLAESQNKKYCYDCKNILNKSEFAKHKLSGDGLNTICKKCRNKNLMAYYHKNSEMMNAKKTEYNRKNKEKILARQRNYTKKRKETDEMFKLCINLRLRAKNYLKIKRFDSRINKKTSEMIGCSPAELKTYIEEKFGDGMTWENYGKYGWHIDHIIPLSSAKTKEEAIRLSHHTNLQPLWWIDNIKKGKKLIN